MCIWSSADKNVHDKNEMWFSSLLQIKEISFSVVYYLSGYFLLNLWPRSVTGNNWEGKYGT